LVAEKIPTGAIVVIFVMCQSNPTFSTMLVSTGSLKVRVIVTRSVLPMA